MKGLSYMYFDPCNKGMNWYPLTTIVSIQSDDVLTLQSKTLLAPHTNMAQQTGYVHNCLLITLLDL